MVFLIVESFPDTSVKILDNVDTLAEVQPTILTMVEAIEGKLVTEEELESMYKPGLYIVKQTENRYEIYQVEDHGLVFSSIERTLVYTLQALKYSWKKRSVKFGTKDSVIGHLNSVNRVNSKKEPPVLVKL